VTAPAHQGTRRPARALSHHPVARVLVTVYEKGESGMAGSDNGGIRAARNLSAAVVAAIAAWSSYSHMVHVALACGERPEVAYALPLSVDGMLIVATIVMVDDKHRAGRVRPTARLAFTTGVLASIAANIAAAHPSIGARVVNAWPALALLLVVEMLARPPAPQVPEEERRPSAQRHEHPLQQAAQQQVPLDTQVPPHAEEPATSQVPLWAQVPHDEEEPATSQVPLQAHAPDDGEDQYAGDVPVNRPGSGTDRPSANGIYIRRPTTVTRQLAHQIIDAEPDLSRAEVAARLGVSPRRLRAVLADPS
jgi:hypothetical protein